MSPQILRHNEIYAGALTDPHVAIEVDDGGGASGVVAEPAVGRAVLDEAVGQHRDAGVVANDADGVVTFSQDQIEDRVRARVIERGFEIHGGVAAQSAEKELSRFAGAGSVRDEHSVGRVVHLAQPVANGGGGFATPLRQDTLMIVHHGIVPTGFGVADEDKAFGHRKASIWNCA